MLFPFKTPIYIIYIIYIYRIVNYQRVSKGVVEMLPRRSHRFWRSSDLSRAMFTIFRQHASACSPLPLKKNSDAVRIRAEVPAINQLWFEIQLEADILGMISRPGPGQQDRQKEGVAGEGIWQILKTGEDMKCGKIFMENPIFHRLQTNRGTSDLLTWSHFFRDHL